ncbi:hypothetical protein [Roseibium album]|uniref:hypothetical protein n=1 Tax=Roseibium album TaxID=311410 RepID=UPI002490E6EA|nr:hypothetical protein [Roseibium album]
MTSSAKKVSRPTGRKKSKKRRGPGQTLSKRTKKLNKLSPKPKRAQPTSKKIVSSLSSRSNSELLAMWQNCLEKLGDEQQKWWHASAEKVLRKIGAEWRKRANASEIPEGQFAWPSTVAERGVESLGFVQAPKEGMLGYLGYRVGDTNGLDSGSRQRILAEVFRGSLPPLDSPEYLEQWGEPKSVARLKKLAETIAALTRNAKRRDASRLSTAIGDWEDDLDFLYVEFYIGRFGFSWPSVNG